MGKRKNVYRGNFYQREIFCTVLPIDCLEEKPKNMSKNSEWIMIRVMKVF